MRGSTRPLNPSILKLSCKTSIRKLKNINGKYTTPTNSRIRLLKLWLTVVEQRLISLNMYVPLQHQLVLWSLALCRQLCLQPLEVPRKATEGVSIRQNPCIDPLWPQHLLFSTLAIDLSIYVKDKNSSEKVKSGIKSPHSSLVSF